MPFLALHYFLTLYVRIRTVAYKGGWRMVLDSTSVYGALHESFPFKPYAIPSLFCLNYDLYDFKIHMILFWS